LYDRKVRKPLPGWEFFEKFFRFREKLGPILLVSIGDDIIGGMVCPVFRDRAVYEWYVCGMDDRYPEHYPSVLATWAAIDYAHNNGFERFDFLGAGSPEHDYGVREFKSRFGGELVRHGRYRRINSRILYAAGKLGLKILGGIKGHAHTG
jgi:lipid II:glycine glycyltransferase (peptidoglycan interpeptide bridge formation enzyme)